MWEVHIFCYECLEENWLCYYQNELYNFTFMNWDKWMFHSIYYSLTHCPLVPHICVSEWGQHWFRWFVAYSTPSLYLNQCWIIVNWTFGNKIHWNSNQNTKLFIHEDASEYIICEMATILSRGDQLMHMDDQLMNSGNTLHWMINESYCVAVFARMYPSPNVNNKNIPIIYIIHIPCLQEERWCTHWKCISERERGAFHWLKLGEPLVRIGQG